MQKTQNQQEKTLLADIHNLENISSQTNSALLQDKKIELENIRNGKIKSYITRARMQWLNEGEKPTSYFCKLENKHFTEKTIRKLQTNNGTVLTDQKQILKEVEQFYANLFKRKRILKEMSSVNEHISQARLKQTVTSELGDLVSDKELGKVLKHMKNNKSPGIDGISADFIKVFWNKLKFFITNAINSCYSKGILTLSMRQTIITCIPKGNKNRSLIRY